MLGRRNSIWAELQLPWLRRQWSILVCANPGFKCCSKTLTDGSAFHTLCSTPLFFFYIILMFIHYHRFVQLTKSRRTKGDIFLSNASVEMTILILVSCYIWSIALYGSETWTLRKSERKCWRALKYGAGGEWRRQNG